MSDVRVAVVGFGYWGSKHVRVLSRTSGVGVAVVDADPGRRALAAEQFPACRIAERLEDVAGWADAAVIATPPRTHHRLARAAIAAGLGVLVEKPLAASVTECEDLVEAADAAGVTLMVGHTFEHSEAVWRVRDIVRSGQLGDIRYIDTARLNLGLYQPDVNVVWDLAPHDVSIITFLLGRLPRSVSAWGGSHGGGPAEDVAHLQLDYGDGQPTAYVHVSWLDPCKVRRVTVVGSEKMVVYNDVDPAGPIRIHDVGVRPAEVQDVRGAPTMEYRVGDTVCPPIAVREPLAVEDDHFVDCVRTGRRPRTDGACGLAVVRVVEAAATSLDLGAPVELVGVDAPAAVG